MPVSVSIRAGFVSAEPEMRGRTVRTTPFTEPAFAQAGSGWNVGKAILMFCVNLLGSAPEARI